MYQVFKTGNSIKGYSIVEILVVIGIIAVLGILATQSITLSLRSSKKGDSIVLVKQELDNAASTIERLLQTSGSVIIGADSLGNDNCVTHNATPSVGFRGSMGSRGDIACVDVNLNFFYTDLSKREIRIASSSGETINFNQRLTSNKINITDCEFKCYTLNEQTYIDFLVKANAKGVGSSEGATVETSRKILIRRANRK